MDFHSATYPAQFDISRIHQDLPPGFDYDPQPSTAPLFPTPNLLPPGAQAHVSPQPLPHSPPAPSPALQPKLRNVVPNPLHPDVDRKNNLDLEDILPYMSEERLFKLAMNRHETVGQGKLVPENVVNRVDVEEVDSGESADTSANWAEVGATSPAPSPKASSGPPEAEAKVVDPNPLPNYVFKIMQKDPKDLEKFVYQPVAPGLPVVETELAAKSRVAEVPSPAHD